MDAPTWRTPGCSLPRTQRGGDARRKRGGRGCAHRPGWASRRCCALALTSPAASPAAAVGPGRLRSSSLRGPGRRPPPATQPSLCLRQGRCHHLRRRPPRWPRRLQLRPGRRRWSQARLAPAQPRLRRQRLRRLTRCPSRSRRAARCPSGGTTSSTRRATGPAWPTRPLSPPPTPGCATMAPPPRATSTPHRPRGTSTWLG